MVWAETTCYMLYLLVAQWRSENMWLFPVALMVAVPWALIRVSRRDKYVILNALIECSIDCPSMCNWPIDVQCPRCLPQCTGGNRAKLPSPRWCRRGRSLREVFACSRLFATTDLSQIYNREARRHGTPCTKTTDSYPFSFLYNNPRKIRRETTLG